MDPLVIASTPWIVDGTTQGGQYRYVLLKHFNPDGTLKEYSTHLESPDGNHYSGNYFMRYTPALTDLARRYTAAGGQ
jgi:hypothetical protein